MSKPVLRHMVVLTLVAASALGACTAPEPPDTTGVADDLVRESATFRTADGLFRLPEAPASPGSALATADFVDVFGQSGEGVVDWKKAAASARPVSSEAADIAAYLHISRAANVAPTPSLLTTMAADVQSPPAQSDIGAEIGAVHALADAYAQLRMAGQRVRPPAAVIARVDSIDPAQLDDSPYLVSRLAETFALLNLAPPAVLTSRVNSLKDKPFPSLNSLKGILDASALVVARGPEAADAWPADAAPTLLRILTENKDLDSLSRASALRLLILMGHRREATPLISAMRESVDPVTGLVRSNQIEQGSVKATYLFSRLLDLRLREVATPATKDALYAAASRASLPIFARVMAAAALKNTGDPRWKQFSPLALQVSNGQPTVLKQADLAEYLSVMQPAADLDPDVPKSEFTPFPVAEGDEVGQREALAAMNNSYLFRNAQTPATSFPELQSQLKSWMQSPASPPAKRIAAAAALADARLAQVQVSLIEAFGAQLKSERGCSEAGSFLSTDGKESSPCSLVITLQAKAIPGFS